MNEPKAIKEGELNIGGITLKTYVLDDGRRVIEEESLIRLFEAMADPDFKITESDAVKIAEFCKGTIH